MARRPWIHSLAMLVLLFEGPALAEPAKAETADVSVGPRDVEAEASGAELSLSEPAGAEPTGVELSGAESDKLAAEPASVSVEPVSPDESFAVSSPQKAEPRADPVALAVMRPSPVRLPQITDAAYRDTRLSAYALPGRTFSFGVKLLGTTTEEMFASLGFLYGLGKGVQVGANLAHMGVGLLNLSTKWTFLDKGPVAVAVGFDPIFVNGDWLWIVRMKQLFAGIDTFLLPVQVSASVLTTPWLQFDLSARYMAGFITGNVATTNIGLDADLTAHEFALFPAVRFHLLGRSTLMVAATLPLYRAAPATAEVEVELAPGVVAGGTLDGTKTKSLDQTYRIEVGIRSMVSRQVFLEFGLNFGPQIEFLYGSPVYPRLGMEVRF